MQTAAHRLEFAPPPQPGLGRALGLALLAHLLLLAALAWGVSWKHEDSTLAAEAELWSALPQQAAPPLEQAPPPPPPSPAAAAPAPPPPAPREADIALAREKKKREQQEKVDKARAQEQAKAKAREASEAKNAEASRQEYLQRMQGLAGATGAADAKGTTVRSSAPSAGYAGKVVELIRQNTKWDDPVRPPTVVVLVRAAPSGLVLSRKVVATSGNKSWDEAVLRGIDRMGSVPRDSDGRIPELLLREGLEIVYTP